MLAEKIKTLCHNLNISVPHPSPQGEYFFSFDDSIFALVLETKNHYVIWSLVGLLPGNEAERNSMLAEIGVQSMKLLTGLTSQFFPTVFVANQELRLGIKIPKNSGNELIEPLTVLIEDVDLWRKGLRIGRTSQPIMPHTSRILKF